MLYHSPAFDQVFRADVYSTWYCLLQMCAQNWSRAMVPPEGRCPEELGWLTGHLSGVIRVRRSANKAHVPVGSTMASLAIQGVRQSTTISCNQSLNSKPFLFLHSKSWTAQLIKFNHHCRCHSRKSCPARLFLLLCHGIMAIFNQWAMRKAREAFSYAHW